MDSSLQLNIDNLNVPSYIFRGNMLEFQSNEVFCLWRFISLANSANPDVMSNSVAFPLGLLCLPNYRFNRWRDFIENSMSVLVR